MKKAIVIFRQDLRIDDNTALIQAIEENDEVFPIFILDKHIIPNFLWLKDKKFLFVKECLLNLNKELQTLNLKLFVSHWKPEEILRELCSKLNIDTIYGNRTYGKYGMERDRKISEFCNLKLFKDFLIMDPEEIPRRQILSAYYKLWDKKILEQGIHCKTPKTSRLPSCEFSKNLFKTYDIEKYLEERIPGGKHPYFTVEGIKSRLQTFDFEAYGETRNNPDIDGTSKTSPWVRFGIISPRRLLLSARSSEDFYRELAFRDFWSHVMYHFPFVKEMEFQPKRRNIPWKYDEKAKEDFFKWCRGETGYPIVDAAMKQLVEENWMHGRTRMIVCSFLTKDLLLDWRWGESFFKQHLLDYDENININTWQWGASVGTDQSPLRIFSPIRQSERFDPQAKYITQYLPQLKGEDLKAIHNPLEYKLNYIPCIVDHRIAQKETKEVYKKYSTI